VFRWTWLTVALASLVVAGRHSSWHAEAAEQGTRLIRSGREVTFIVEGNPTDPPRIVADFNGWDGGTMTPSPDGRTFTLQVTLDPAARIEYLIAYRDRFVVDAGNPRTVPAPAGPPRSELRMPLYRDPPALPVPRRRGTIEEIAFESRAGERRRIRVYVPAGDVGPAKAGSGPHLLPDQSRPPRPESRIAMPVLYVHDGDIVLDRLELPALLDSLIEARQMAPVVVAFIDAVDRHDDYEPGSPFRAVLLDEIVPSIERRFAGTNPQRAIMGLSRSTVGALDTCVNGGIRFDACILVAPAIAPRQFATLLPPPGSASATRFAIATGTYDIPLVADARALRDELQRRRLAVDYAEQPQGHNHTAFRAALPDLMRRAFPRRSESGSDPGSDPVRRAERGRKRPAPTP
jgi:enterochelin esterase-like enzyme